MEQIIQENNINEEAAREFLNDCYKGINLLPNVPAKITRQIAAAVLNVSMPTIERMLQDNQLKLTRKSLQKYIFDNMLYIRPLQWEDEDQMKAKPRELTPKEKQESEKAFKDIEESIAGLNKIEEDLPGLFSEEDLKQR